MKVMSLDPCTTFDYLSYSLDDRPSLGGRAEVHYSGTVVSPSQNDMGV